MKTFKLGRNKRYQPSSLEMKHLLPSTSSYSDSQSSWVGMQERRSVVGVRQQVLVCLGLFLLGYMVLLQTDLDTHHLFIPDYGSSEGNGGMDVATKGCSIPALDPWDASVLSYAKSLDPEVNCKRNPDFAIVDGDTIRAIGNATCCYTPFYRITVNASEPLKRYSGNVGVQFRFGRTCFPIVGNTDVGNEEFIQVTCENEEDTFTDYFAFVPPRVRDKGSFPTPNKNLSVLIIGLDGLSRLNFIRTMPKSHAFFNERSSAFEMLGFNKVGDNTFPNLLPVLLGQSEAEVKQSCWPSTTDIFDNCPFIWDDFKKAGFATAFAEDASWMGCFEYQKYGFRKQPTDYYYRIFNHLAEQQIGHEKRLNAHLCLGNRLNMAVLVDAIGRWALRMVGKLSFGFFWENSLTHDYLTLPRQGDDYLIAMLKKLEEKQVFENSVVILMSDHGIRWGGIRTTYQGYLEERLPLLIVSVPKWFQRIYPHAFANLKANRRRLLSHFDLHATLLDLVDQQSLKNDKVLEREAQLQRGSIPRSISLFLRVPDSRTCQDANISSAWCTCHQSVQVPTNDSVVVAASNFLVFHLNNVILSGYQQCSHLRLDAILGSRIYQTEPDERMDTIKDYSVRIRTVPGKAVFEATIRKKPQQGIFALIGTITRSNLYGGQSYCVSHYHIKMYCYCRSLLDASTR